MNPILSSVDSAELYVAWIYFKTSNSFSHTPLTPFHYRIKTGEHPLVLLVCAPSSPLISASTKKTCLQVGCWQDKDLWQEGQLDSVDRTPPPPRAGIAGLQSFQPSKNSSQLQGAKAHWSLELQSPLSTHSSALSGAEVGAMFMLLPSCSQHPPAPELMEMGG